MTDIRDLLEVPQPNVSQHLTVLRQQRIVDFSEDGKLRCYYLRRPTLVQALLLQTEEKRIIITGCAHPGIVAIVQRLAAIPPELPMLVMGGFHLKDSPADKIGEIVQSLEALGTRWVAPTHCTGEQAEVLFADRATSLLHRNKAVSYSGEPFTSFIICSRKLSFSLRMGRRIPERSASRQYTEKIFAGRIRVIRAIRDLKV